jgi:hypothetical protein
LVESCRRDENLGLLAEMKVVGQAIEGDLHPALLVDAVALDLDAGDPSADAAAGQRAQDDLGGSPTRMSPDLGGTKRHVRVSSGTAERKIRHSTGSGHETGMSVHRPCDRSKDRTKIRARFDPSCQAAGIARQPVPLGRRAGYRLVLVIAR